MSARLASELCELAAPRPSFRLSEPHALAAPAAAAHARARSPSSPLRGSPGSRAPGPAPARKRPKPQQPRPSAGSWLERPAHTGTFHAVPAGLVLICRTPSSRGPPGLTGQPLAAV